MTESSEFSLLNNTEDSTAINTPINVQVQVNTTTNKLKELKEYLEELSLSNLFDFARPDPNPELYPLSYRSNSNIERKCLNFLKVFKRQYKNRFSDRLSLLLTPKNECSTKKFICTYICPVRWQYPEFGDWEGCASFIADHLDSEPICPSNKVPKIIYSPTTIMQLQKGNSFDYSILLCSLLIGAGFDAYVVSGYATKECCFADQTRTECPLLVKQEPELPPIKPKPFIKYSVKPIKTFHSRYDIKMIANRLQKTKNQELKEKQEEEDRRRKMEKPSPDPLFGLRVHAWVLVKTGRRDISEDFFIEPFTGNRHTVTDKQYLGIESVFNDQNYWYNKFYCINALRNQVYDLGNLAVWEAIIPDGSNTLDTSVDHHLLHRNTEEENDSVKNNNNDNFIDVPLSWVCDLRINNVTYERRYPQSQNVINYYKVQQFKYSPYFCLSGLRMRLKIYADRDYNELMEVQEFLDNREDKHFKTVIRDGQVTEFFYKGNMFVLEQYTYEKENPEPENNRTLRFYENSRVDGLVQRVETKTSVSNTFKNRKDFLESSFVQFAPRNCDIEEAKESFRNIEYIVNRYRRNRSLSPNEDIAKLQFLLTEDRIIVRYHVGEQNIVASTRNFVKPLPTNDGKNTIVMQNDTHTSFESDPFARKKTQLEIYELLKYLIHEEKRAVNDVRTFNMDMKVIIKKRAMAKREDFVALSLFDTIRNDQAREKRRDIDKEYHLMMSKQEENLDFLAPYMAQHNILEVSTRVQAFQVRESCLYDLKYRLIKQANLIRNRFEIETNILQKKQTWYYQNKMVLSLEEEQKYLAYCANTVSLLNTMENLLSRHKQSAPHKYMEMERRIQKDPRMAKFM